MRPSCMTTTRWAIDRTSGRLCVTNRMLSPRSSLQFAQQRDDRRPAPTRRARSSPRRTAAPSARRSARARSRPAAARRRTARPDTSRRTARQRHPLEHPGDPRAARRGAARRAAPAGGRPTAPTVRRGFSEPYGFWKMYWISRLASRRAARADAGERRAAQGDRAVPVVVQPGDRSATTVVLPLPDSPTSARHSRSPTAKVDVVHDLGVAVARASARRPARSPSRTIGRRARPAPAPWSPASRATRRRGCSARCARAPTTTGAGSCGVALGDAQRAARRERAAGRPRAGRRRRPGIAVKLRADLDARHRGDQQPRVRMRGRGEHLSAAPCSTSRPAYITATRSAKLPTTDRSCDTYSAAAPSS